MCAAKYVISRRRTRNDNNQLGTHIYIYTYNTLVNAFGRIRNIIYIQLIVVLRFIYANVTI